MRLPPPLLLLQLLLLLALLARPQPADWADRALSGDLLYVNADGASDATAIGDAPAVRAAHLPSLANGYLGLQVGAESLFVAGLFSGAALAPARRARVPAALPALRVRGAPRLHAALDLQHATYVRRSFVPPRAREVSAANAAGACSAARLAALAAAEAERGDEGGAAAESCTPLASRVWLEQRLYAHRVLRHVFVAELELLGADGEGAANWAQPRDEHAPGEAHARGHTSHGHVRPAEERDFLDVELEPPPAMAPPGRGGDSGGGGGGGGGGDNGGSAPRRRAAASVARLGPLRNYAPADWALQQEGAAQARAAGGGAARRPAGAGGPTTRGMAAAAAAAAAAPLAVLRLSLGGEGAAQGAALGGADRREEIDFQDVTAAACDFGAAAADALTRAALRGCGAEWTVQAGYVREPELPDLEHAGVAVLTSRLPPFGVVALADVGTVVPLFTVVCTTLELPAGASLQQLVVAAARQYELAAALAAQRVLFALHAAAWRQGLWRSGIEVEPDGSGRAPRLGALLNASLHSILSLARADWPMGLSPGGLSTNGYNGWAL
jgi:hypothetical protein